MVRELEAHAAEHPQRARRLRRHRDAAHHDDPLLRARSRARSTGSARSTSTSRTSAASSSQQSAQIRPAPITVDPPPFAFKLPATFTLEGIQGRVIVEGGDAFETAGDTLVVHNGAGLAASGLLTNRAVPRMVQVGQDANGAPIYAGRSESGIVDRYVSLEGLGLNIPLEGFTGPRRRQDVRRPRQGHREHRPAPRRRAAAAGAGGADLAQRQLHRRAARPPRLGRPRHDHRLRHRRRRAARRAADRPRRRQRPGLPEADDRQRHRARRRRRRHASSSRTTRASARSAARSASTAPRTSTR